MQVKWTAILTAIVALVMSVSSLLTLRAQGHMLTQQAIDAGISLSKFVAVQAAIPVLGEDWITLESFVQDAADRQSFRYLTIADHNGIVRAASEPSWVGSAWAPGESDPIIYSNDGVVVTDKEDLFNFSLPVLFNDTRVGDVNMGLDTSQLEEALDTTKRMMVILGFAVILAAAIAFFIFNKLIAKHILLTTRALKLFGAGQMQTRISRDRSDEFGDMFKAFNQMADTLEPLVEYTEADVEEDTDIVTASPLDNTEIDISGISQGEVDDVTVVRMNNETKNNTE